MDVSPYAFASDNTSGLCPEALAALVAANDGPTGAYGDDPWTTQAAELIRDLVGAPEAEVFFALTGTAANSMALAAACLPHHGVICTDVAHVHTDECGAPEFFTGGTKLITTPHVGGKLTPEAITAARSGRRDVHFPRIRAISVTQATEFGTVYRPDELAAIRAAADGLIMHMDGARFANAVAGLGLSPREILGDVGVDVVTLGGAKNGLPLSEAIVFLSTDLAEEFAYRRKQSGQLASKMRVLSASWVGVLGDGAWLANAQHANRMAAELESRLAEIGVRTAYPRQANGLFLDLSDAAFTALEDRGWHIYQFTGGVTRMMCSWATTHEEIDAICADVEAVVAAA